MKKVIFCSLLATTVCAFAVSNNLVVFAQHSHEKHDMQNQPSGAQQKSFQQLMDDAMTTMDSGMKGAPMTGDPDHDFAAMMIPHHQGAINMAKAELLYGKDPALRRLAQEMVVTQGQEIQVMRMRLKQFKNQ